jgi:hypothetical protein
LHTCREKFKYEIKNIAVAKMRKNPCTAILLEKNTCAAWQEKKVREQFFQHSPPPLKNLMVRPQER